MKPVVFGLSGPTLSSEERALFALTRPAGYILFKHNCIDRVQLRALTDALRELEGREDVAILIDEEGGRVSRLTPPEWPAHPGGPAFDRLYELAPISGIEAARANAHALGLMLSEAGVTVNCAPVLDVADEATSEAIACRAYGGEPLRVAAMGRATLEGLAEGGVVGVVKHLPGYGRATVDPHHHLPVVAASAAELERDLLPFRRLAHAAMGMTAHIVFEAWDRERPATQSPVVIAEVIRGLIEFDGLLMTDDIDMKALSGTAADKAVASVAAGCDVVLDCWSPLSMKAEVAARLPDMTPRACERLAAAMAARAAPAGDRAALVAKRDALLALTGDDPGRA